jgi:hypothetical protein
MKLKNITWRKGFNRIFILLCIGWLIFVIYEPVYKGRSFAAQNYTLQLEQADESYRLDGDEIKWKKAENDADATFRRLWNDASFSNSLKEAEHDPKIILFIVLIPAAFYLFVIGAVWLVRWTVNGFRGKAEDLKS